ncbi:MAG: alanine/glycine:cation symporter family protein [Eubacteriales bacterium]
MDTIYRVFLGPAVLAGLFSVGGYFSVRLKCFWWLHPKKCLREMRGEHSAASIFPAVTLALGGTMGVGNIAGVALACLTGGAGAIFWMVVSALFAMAVKYAEVVLAMDTRVQNADGTYTGGAPYYMRRADGRNGFFPYLFSALCVLSAVFQGSLLQGNALGESCAETLGVAPCFIGIALGILALVFLLFARSFISRATACLIPVSTVLYLILCLSLLFLRRAEIPAVFARIFREAFSPRAGVAGVAGYLFTDAARIGCARGLVSNEAGCGTSPLAHVSARGTSPAGQGLWGVFEVFLDTVVVCTLTALVCLSSGAEGDPNAPLSYVTDALAALFGRAAQPLLTVAVAGFALATVVSWAYYGLTCLSSLSHRAWVRVLFLVLYAGGLVIGAVSKPVMVYHLIDLLLGVMTLTNLFFLLKKADRVVALSAERGLIQPRPECATATSPRETKDAQGNPPVPAPKSRGSEPPVPPRHSRGSPRPPK